MPDIRSVLTTLGQVVEISDVTNIVVTEIVDDTEGGFIRSIRIFGEPLGVGAPAILEVRVRAQDKIPIQVTTPTLDF